MILDRADMVILTQARTRKGQIEVLARNGIRFVVGADGWPRVHEAAVVQAPGTAVVALPKRHEREPNFDAIRAS